MAVHADEGRRVLTLTDAGRDWVQERRDGSRDPFAGRDGPHAGPDLRGLLEQVHSATRGLRRAGSDAQVGPAAEILRKTRRRLYLLLADEPQGQEPQEETDAAG